MLGGGNKYLTSTNYTNGSRNDVTKNFSTDQNGALKTKYFINKTKLDPLIIKNKNNGSARQSPTSHFKNANFDNDTALS